MVEVTDSDDCDGMQARPVPRDLFTSWQAALEHWSDDAKHDTLLGIAAKHQQLAWLAARYAAAARSNPHDTIARDRLERVRRASAVLAFRLPATREVTSKTPRAAAMLLLASMAFAGLGLWLTDFMSHQQQQRTIVSRHP